MDRSIYEYTMMFANCESLPQSQVNNLFFPLLEFPNETTNLDADSDTNSTINDYERYKFRINYQNDEITTYKARIEFLDMFSNCNSLSRITESVKSL